MKSQKQENQKEITLLKVALTSKSAIKIDVVKRVLDLFTNLKYELIPFHPEPEIDLPQPLNKYGLIMARARINWLRKNHQEELASYHLIVSMENFIATNCQEDYACIILYDPIHDFEYQTTKLCAPLPDLPLYLELACSYPVRDPTTNELVGMSKTYGQLYHERHPEIPADDWMSITANRPRIDSLVEGLSLLAKRYHQDIKLLNEVESQFRYIQDFPVKGVNFKAWDDIFLRPKLMNHLIEYIANKYYRDDIDYVIGVESRGFLLSSRLATKLESSEVLLRKKGKVAGPKISQSYTKEYGEDTLELRSDLPTGRVLICDDILATGGSLRAAVDLARTAGHTVVDCILVQDVPALRDLAKKNLEDIPVRILIKEL